MNLSIIKAGIRFRPEGGYIGQVAFSVEGHGSMYEIMLYSDDGEEWDYGLHFLADPGSEEEISAVEEELEENDEAFDRLVQAALDQLE